MTTPILPTKTALLAYTLTPTELIADQADEVFLADHYALLAGFLAAWRLGQTSYSYTASDAGVAASLRSLITRYGYTVTAVDPEATSVVEFSWD